MPIVDPFTGDGFTTTSLTASILALEVPRRRIAELNVFPGKGIATRSVLIEEDTGTLSLIANQPVGAPPNLHAHSTRVARSVAVPHLPIESRVQAEDSQGKRRFGSESELEGPSDVVADHLQRMADSLSATREHLRASGLAGIVLDADGSTVLANFFTLFDVSESTVDFKIGTDTMLTQLIAVKRLIETAMEGIPFDHVHALASSGWWDAFTGDADTKAAWNRFNEGAFLRTDSRSGFNYGGIIIEEYSHSVGGVPMIAANTVRFFPVGVNLGQECWAPANFNEAVNTIGLEMYAKQEPTRMGMGIDLHAQSNPLPIFFKPAALVKGTHST